MDTTTIKLLIKIAEANLKVARREFNEIKNNPDRYEEEYEWEDALDEAGRESYACEEVVRFLNANLERTSYIESIEPKWYWTNFPYKVRVHKAHQIWLVGFVI